nr:hypothetical protein GCM10020093_115650 [Planobispora longispora]
MRDVKPEGKRARQRRATRHRIVESALELFVGQGYAATTLEQIAACAGVAVQTVYFHFGNKRTILIEGIGVKVVGDDEQVAMIDRSWAQEALTTTDPPTRWRSGSPAAGASSQGWRRCCGSYATPSEPIPTWPANGRSTSASAAPITGPSPSTWPTSARWRQG